MAKKGNFGYCSRTLILRICLNYMLSRAYIFTNTWQWRLMHIFQAYTFTAMTLTKAWEQTKEADNLEALFTTSKRPQPSMCLSLPDPKILGRTTHCIVVWLQKVTNTIWLFTFRSFWQSFSNCWGFLFKQKLSSTESSTFSP